MKFNKNLSAIHSYLCADGYVIKNPEHQKHKYYSIGFRNKNHVLLLDFQKKFENVFGKRPFICKDGRCRINSKEIYFNLINDFNSFYSADWKLPDLTKENLRIWLRAFFDCEAWVYVKKHKDRHIGLDSINHKGLIDIYKSLKLFGIKTKIKKLKNRNIYRLYIFGKENISLFQKEIGFLHPNKNNKLRNAIESYMNYIWFFPRNKKDIKMFLKKLMLEKAKVKKPYIIRIVSNKEENLISLSKNLDNIYGIKSKIYKGKNCVGTIFYTLNIQKKKYVKEFIKNNLLNQNQINKINNKILKTGGFINERKAKKNK